MASQRIKGQEVELQLVIDGTVQDTVTAFSSFEISAELEKLEESYLGEKTPRFDEIFNGISGSLDFHSENKSVFNIMQSIIDRAKRRTPGTQINLKATLNYPNGDRPRVLLQDVYFGAIPLNFGSRSDYGSVSLDFSCSDIKVL